MISTRSVELVIDTVVCLTLAKWETVSGQFGGYLRYVPPTSNRSKPPRIFHKSCSANGGGSKNGGRPSPGRGGVRNFYRVLFGLSAKFPNVCKSLTHGNYPKPGTTIAID